MSAQLKALWDFLEPLHHEIFGLAFTLVAALLLWSFRSRVRLIYGRANNSLNHVSLPNPEDENSHNHIEVYVEKFFVQNSGRRTATNVEFILSAFPTDVSVWEPREVSYKPVEKGNCLIAIPQIAPGELVIIDCVYLNMRAARITSVKCAEALGKEVNFGTFRRFPGWFNFTAVALMLLGVAFVAQTFFSLMNGPSP
ncbi:MAG: hypothetical protein AAFO80_07220 [Pseudomonadota bacterium]